jgi:hypothetical protein
VRVIEVSLEPVRIEPVIGLFIEGLILDQAKISLDGHGHRRRIWREGRQHSSGINSVGPMPHSQPDILHELAAEVRESDTDAHPDDRETTVVIAVTLPLLFQIHDDSPHRRSLGAAALGGENDGIAGDAVFSRRLTRPTLGA